MIQEVTPHVLHYFGLIIAIFMALWLIGMAANWIVGPRPEKIVSVKSKEPFTYPSNVRIVHRRNDV